MKEKSSSTSKKLACCLILVCLCVPFRAHGQDASTDGKKEKAISRMDEMVVTATGVDEPKRDVPQSVQVITQEDIRNSPAKDAGDLIIEAALGHVQKSNGALTSMVEIRGLQTDQFSPLSSRVLILVNGSNAGTVNLAKIPRDYIERIEIVKGPASVLYGSSAMGGVINIITKEGKGPFQGSVYGEGGSWNYWKAGADVSGKTGRFDYFVTGSGSGQGNYDVPALGKYNNTQYTDETAYARFGYTFFNDQHISAGFQHWQGWNIGSPGATYSPDPDDFANKGRDAFDVNYNMGTLAAKYYYVKDVDLTHSTPGSMGTGGPGNGSIYNTYITTQGARLQKDFAIGDHRIIAGGQWDRIQIDNRNNQGAPYNPNARYDDYGAFAEGRLSLLQKRLLLTGGLRYDYFDNKMLPTHGLNEMSNSKSLDHVTARGGVVYKLTDALSLKGTGGTAFRAPAPLELAGDYTVFGTRFVGNTNLKPEQSTTFDAGIDYLKGFFKGNLTYFHTDFTDKIVTFFDMTRFVSTYQNVGSATIAGVELNSSYDIGAAAGLPITIEPFTNITYKTTYTQTNQGDRPDSTLTYTPKWTGAFGVRVGQEKWDAGIIANYLGWQKVTDYNPSSPTYGQLIHKAGFTVLGLRGHYRPVKSLELTASVENLLDRRYEYVQGFPMPGMTVIGGAKYFF
jgi:vitamin B12 transporter